MYLVAHPRRSDEDRSIVEVKDNGGAHVQGAVKDHVGVTVNVTVNVNGFGGLIRYR